MPPKRKASCPPKVGKQGKKGNQNVKECIPALAEDEGVEKTNYQSEIICDKSNKKQLFVGLKKKLHLLNWWTRTMTSNQLHFQILL